MTARRPRALLALFVAGVALLTAGCSDESPMELSVTGTEMAFQAPDTVAPGAYLVRFSNKGLVYHEVAVSDSTGKVLRRTSAAAGATSTMEVELESGRYELGCFEPGHYEAGMFRDLLVE